MISTSVKLWTTSNYTLNMSPRLLQNVTQPCGLSKLTSFTHPPRIVTSSIADSHRTSQSRAVRHFTQPTRPPTPTPIPTPTPSSQKHETFHEDPSFSSFNLFQQIRSSRPAVRYTVYAGFGLMVTVESTFWFNVIKAKLFPSASEEDKRKAEQFLEDVRSAIAGYKATWMGNYGRYYGGYVWGVGER
jgi:hypothetical protein